MKKANLKTENEALISLKAEKENNTFDILSHLIFHFL